MDMDWKMSDGSGDDHVLLLTNAATGAGAVMDRDNGNALATIALALEGRTLVSPDDQQRWDWMLTEQQTMAVVGMLMIELSPETQAQLINVWRADGVPGL